MSAPDLATWFNKKLIKNSRHKDTVPAECPAVNRLRIILEHYHSYIESNGGLNGINNNLNRGVGMYIFISRTLPNYSIIRLLNDYHHILTEYYNQFTTVNKLLINNISYDITTSIIFARNNRNRQHCSIKNDIRCEYYGGYNASEEVSIQKMMDKIYCHLILSFDAGYILNQNEILQIATTQIEESKEIISGEEKDNKDDAVDMPLKMIVNITRKKSQLLHKIRGKKRMKHNKFVSHFNEQNNENKENTNTYEIEFGYQFKYWKSYSNNKWYISTKYENLKSEMTLNKLCKMSDKQFEDDIKSSIAYINCKRGRKLKCKYLSENYNEPTQEEIKIMPNSLISIDHMLALIIFTNYDIIRKNIISVYNKLNKSETDIELKKRHREYYNMCKLLYECIRLYGTNISKYNGFQMTFYHSFNKQIYFDEFHSYFYYPTSTTTSLNVINMYSPDNGLILQLKKDIEYQGDQHYFDCSWFSDYGIESEKLFLNIMLSFKSILYPKLFHNYSQYLNAFNVLQSMIIGTELNYNILTPLIGKFLAHIINKKLQKIPKYIYELFQTFRETIDNIQINVWLMIIDSYEIMDDDMDDSHLNDNYERPPNDGNQYGFLKLHSLFIQNDGWIYIDRLLLLFPNTKHIQLYNGNIQTGQILPCITLDESTMNNLLNILDNKYIKENTNIKKISFYYPDEQLLNIQTILKHFTQWFTKINWKIKFEMKKAPFLPDKCKLVRTLIVKRQ